MHELHRVLNGAVVIAGRAALSLAGCLAIAACASAPATARRSIEARVESADHAPNCQDLPGKPTISPDVLQHSCASNGAAEQVRFFDDFSWRQFVAVMWPAQVGERGKPDRTASLTDVAVNRVFETYKADWETFRGKPSPWRRRDSDNPCKTTPPRSQLVLASNSKLSIFTQGHFGPVGVHALPSQFKTWVTYQTSFNEFGYQQIVDNKLYDAKVLAGRSPKAPLVFTNSAINIKSAWVEIPSEELRKKYYSQEVLAYDPALGKCRMAHMSLIGLHIVSQTPESSPYWIWSTFEHVDNVSSSKAIFNDGTGDGMPTDDPNRQKINWVDPQRYNLAREFRAIRKETDETNASYQAKVGSVLSKYRLVMTHWPGTFGHEPEMTDPERMLPKPAPDPNATANPVLETFVQDVTCMSCHVLVANRNYVWALESRVASRVGPDGESLIGKPPNMTPALSELEQLLSRELERRRTRTQ